MLRYVEVQQSKKNCIFLFIALTLHYLCNNKRKYYETNTSPSSSTLATLYVG